METIIEMSVGPWVPKPSTNASFEDKPVSAIGCECCQDLLEDCRGRCYKVCIEKLPTITGVKLWG